MAVVIRLVVVLPLAVPAVGVRPAVLLLVVAVTVHPAHRPVATVLPVVVGVLRLARHPVVLPATAHPVVRHQAVPATAHPVLLTQAVQVLAVQVQAVQVRAAVTSLLARLRVAVCLQATYRPAFRRLRLAMDLLAVRLRVGMARLAVRVAAVTVRPARNRRPAAVMAHPAMALPVAATVARPVVATVRPAASSRPGCRDQAARVGRRWKRSPLGGMR